MKLILFLFFVVGLVNCGGNKTQKDPNLVANQATSSSLLSAMGDILKSAYDKSYSTACDYSKTEAICDLTTAGCTHSDFTLSASGSACAVNFYLRNETRTVTGGARGTFSWTVTTANPANMPSYVRSIEISGSQEYKNNGNEINGRVRIEGNIYTEEVSDKEKKYSFSIDGHDNFSMANRNTVGQSDIKLSFSGKTDVEGTQKPFLVVLQEQAGFNSNHNNHSLNYYLDNASIGLAEFRTFSELGITFFFKSTSTSTTKPWLGYVGPIKDFLSIPTGL